MTQVVNIKFGKDYDVLITRPGPWGNPWSHLPWWPPHMRTKTRRDSIEKFRRYLLSNPDLIEKGRRYLKGKVLGCVCRPEECHGDVWAEVLDA
ncbi:DUF4326 domain-containing protein [Methylobacter sp.]|uniref:DUF4326 domain-containing protein n=1 Tax=Methylobacter sp. TaxID=2051955 RepID=UPI001203BB19|nr:MAG: DUF4326 domain-containing protein [Methylobacter sp.]